MSVFPLVNYCILIVYSAGGTKYSQPRPVAASYQPANTRLAEAAAPVQNVLAAKQRWQPRIPTGPRKMRVMKAGEAKSMPSVGNMGRIPCCSSCHTQIRLVRVIFEIDGWGT